jgi:hypothetical protein
MKLDDIKDLYYEKHLTQAELKKREDIAQAMEKENPGMGSTSKGMSKKMAIATAAAKKCCSEETEQLDEISKYDLVVTYYRHLGLDPYKLRGAVGTQLRKKIKNSPAFHAWLHANKYESVEGISDDVISETKKAAEKSAKNKGADVEFYGYPDNSANNFTTSDTVKDETGTNFNYLSPN